MRGRRPLRPDAARTDAPQPRRNALRYTEQGEIRLGCEVSDGTVRISVGDTGIGIPPEHLERIFEEFHQVANPERDRSQGLGLGLAIVKRLSKLLNHPVWVRSEPGKGSVFAIDVPLGSVEAVPAEALCTPAAAAGPGLVALVVDDDAMVLTGLRTVLEGWGYQVLIAGSGDEALEILRDAGRAPDVVVDYRLREGEVEAAVVRRIREFVGRVVPGVLLTGETGSENQQEAAENELDLAHKPLTPPQLHSALERQMRVVE
ncbi:ATP-binding protein [Azospirillum argentinense]